VNAITQGICILTVSGCPVSSLLVLGISEVALGLAMLAGVLTPIVSSVLSVGYLVECVSVFVSSDVDKHANALTAACLASMCVSIALLGPGAFSIDARLFGRLEIIIPERRRPSGKD
jgi:uncharacterized membrane protein YphA (DoxX/SURF4 family)